MKVLEQSGIKLVSPGSAVRLTFVARHVPTALRGPTLIVEGRKELKYWLVRALIVEILFAFLILYRDVSLTVGGIREDK